MRKAAGPLPTPGHEIHRGSKGPTDARCAKLAPGISGAVDAAAEGGGGGGGGVGVADGEADGAGGGAAGGGGGCVGGHAAAAAGGGSGIGSRACEQVAARGTHVSPCGAETSLELDLGNLYIQK